MSTIIQLRRDTAANWTFTNPVLAIGEAGIETDTYKWKVGNATDAWNDLTYMLGSGGGGGGSGAELVMRANASISAAYVTKDFGSDQNEVWISFGLAFSSDALTFWNGDGSGDFATALSSGDAIIGAITEFTEAGPTPNWYLYGGSSNDEEVGPPAPTPDAWQDCELHVHKTGTTLVEFYSGGTLVATFTDAETFGIRKLSVGQRGSPTNGADDIVYIRRVLVGTARHGSDIFSDNFSSANLSKWTTTGDCRVVVDPFAQPSPVLNSFVARVDASGNDETGTVGDDSRPFLTVQAAMDAIGTLTSNSGFPYAIDIGNNQFSEDLVSALRFVQFMGRGMNFASTGIAFNTLDLTTSSSTPGLIMDAANGGNIVFSNATGNATVQLARFAEIGTITQSGTGGLIIYGDFVNLLIGAVSIADTLASVQVSDVQYGGDITCPSGSAIILSRFGSFGTLNANGGDIQIINTIGPYTQEASPPYQGSVTVDSATSLVWAWNAVLLDVTAAGTLNLVDSRVVGTNSASTTLYPASFQPVLTLHPLSAAPSSPVEGTIYHNSSDHHLYVYNGTTWKQLDN